MTAIVEGIVAYPITPFTSDDTIDVPALHSLLDRMIDAGVNALAPLGSTGEAAYLSDDEWALVATESIAHTARRVPTVVGISALTTASTVERARLAERAGASAVMALPTSYWHLTDEELRQHFTTVAAAVDLPVMIYNNPATTGIDMSPELLFDLYRSVENITMVKESTGDITRMHRLRELSGGELPFFNGSNPLAYRAFQAGAAGWCTAAPCLIPESIVAFYQAISQGRQSYAEAMAVHLQPFLEMIVSRGLPTTIKSGLGSLGIDVGTPRRPLLPLDDDTTTHLHELIVQARG